jgi:esterase
LTPAGTARTIGGDAASHVGNPGGQHVTARILAHQGHGDGPPALMLLHGFLGSSRNLGGLGRRLAGMQQGRSVLAFDLTGHGVSPPLPPEADLATLAGDVLATADALGVHAPLRLVAHSLGGRVALRAAELEPARVGHVALLDIGPSAIPPGATETARVVEVLLAAPAVADRDAFRAHFRAGGLDNVLTEWLLLNLSSDGDRYRWAVDRGALAALHTRTSAEDLWAVVERPRPWTLQCVRGGGSAYVSDLDAARLEAAGCPVATISGAGHFLHVERPAEVVAALEAGLRGRPPARDGR